MVKRGREVAPVGLDGRDGISRLTDLFNPESSSIVLPRKVPYVCEGPVRSRSTPGDSIPVSELVGPKRHQRENAGGIRTCAQDLRAW